MLRHMRDEAVSELAELQQKMVFYAQNMVGLFTIIEIETDLLFSSPMQGAGHKSSTHHHMHGCIIHVFIATEIWFFSMFC